MKNLVTCFALLIGVFTISCKKETTAQPQSAPAPISINVEYRIQSASGNVVANYLTPQGGKLVSVTQTISRTYESITFNYTSGNLFSVKAFNATPSHDVVQVQIYMNGVLFKEGSASSPSETAIAEGNY
jgi:hypothetical protein